MNVEEWQEISRYNSDVEAEGVVWLNGMNLMVRIFTKELEINGIKLEIVIKEECD